MREVKRTAMLLVSIIFGTTLLVPALVVAQETTPSVPATETPEAPPEESGPFGFWLKYDGATDSRQLDGAPKTPERVNWVFLVSGVPPGTESHLWANFESGGTVETYGQSFLTVSTAGHDKLLNASSHSMVTNRAEAEGASLTLQSITFVGGEPEVAADKSTKDEPRQTSSKASPEVAEERSGSSRPAAQAEPFLPYTGANDALLYYAAFFAIVGLGLRQVA